MCIVASATRMASKCPLCHPPRRPPPAALLTQPHPVRPEPRSADGAGGIPGHRHDAAVRARARATPEHAVHAHDRRFRLGRCRAVLYQRDVTTREASWLFARLPVVVVDDWSEVTPALLRSELDRIARSSFDFSQLELDY